MLWGCTCFPNFIFNCPTHVKTQYQEFMAINNCSFDKCLAVSMCRWRSKINSSGWKHFMTQCFLNKISSLKEFWSVYILPIDIVMEMLHKAKCNEGQRFEIEISITLLNLLNITFWHNYNHFKKLQPAQRLLISIASIAKDDHSFNNFSDCVKNHLQ